jgi:hypothetical protein
MRVIATALVDAGLALCFDAIIIFRRNARGREASSLCQAWMEIIGDGDVAQGLSSIAVRGIHLIILSPPPRPISSHLISRSPRPRFP